MRVLGVDPGSRALGLSVLEQDGAGVLRVLHREVLRPGEGDLMTRMTKIWAGLHRVLDLFPVDLVALEEGFQNTHPRATDVLAKTRGLIMGAAIARQLPVRTYAPNVAKRVVCGYGAARKEQVQGAVRCLLGLEDMPASDEADAMAVGLCALLAGGRG